MIKVIKHGDFYLKMKKFQENPEFCSAGRQYAPESNETNRFIVETNKPQSRSNLGAEHVYLKESSTEVSIMNVESLKTAEMEKLSTCCPVNLNEKCVCVCVCVGG